MTKNRLHEIIFEADTRAGKNFDIALLLAIVISVGLLMVDSVKSISSAHKVFFYVSEWIFTGLFTIEYLLRIWITKKPIKYVFSFYGLIDLLSILPTFLEIFMAGTGSLMVIRVFRLLRVFRVLKLVQFINEARVLMDALRTSRKKITVFIFFIITITVLMGTVMYIIEGGENGFTSIPRSMYWAIVTLTTVGYGDIAPQTVLGQTVASIIMILGYGVIAIPTGIVGAEIIKSDNTSTSTQVCQSCSMEGHDDDAKHCKYCGAEL
jgi:voltage-gated potassium channel